MYLKRKIDDYLINWKNSGNKKPLIVKGARQIGKTESIRKFATENYESFIEINFVLEPKYKAIISEGYLAKDIVKNISLINTQFKFIPGKTLIFFDEIQDFPEITTSLKSFCVDKKYDVICSGSILGINYNRIDSISIGYKSDYQMFSLDFEEFLFNLGYDEKVIEMMLNKMLNAIPFSENEINVFSNLFFDYIIASGMPSVCSSFIEKGTFEGTLEMLKQLIEDYKGDIRKYTVGIDQARVLSVFKQIPFQLAKEFKKFQISKVSHGATSKDYLGCIQWLEDAGIINICYSLNDLQLPILGNMDTSKYKIYFFDTGLLIAQLDDEVQIDLRANKNLGVYKGGLYENMVAESFIKQGLPICYYKKEDSTLEEDFFLRDCNNLIPIEVKSNNNRSKSLQTLIKEDKYSEINYGIKLCKSNVGFTNSIYTFPYFCSFLIKRFLELK